MMIKIRFGSKPIRRSFEGFCCRGLSTKSGIPIDDSEDSKSRDHWDSTRVNAYVGQAFPDFIEWWSRETFRRTGYTLGVGTAALSTAAALTDLSFAAPVAFGLFTAGYWRVGLTDMRQTSHAVRRNYPVLGNMRYILETIRPELRQYIVEADDDGKPFDRNHRAQIYQRAKNVDDTIPFGTRRNVYQTHHEWALHSMFPQTVTKTKTRHSMGTAEFGTSQPYSASVLNVSAMSYGALSNNAILALNQGAKMGGFYHNTGEGGVSEFHRKGGGDLVWNVGTGYFGCGTNQGDHRIFDPAMLRDTVDECDGRIKMIEIKLSQGAKPGHGGLLPKSKITPEIAEARKIPYPPTVDCHSPSRHSAFSNAFELVEFIARVREASGGLPVGIKMCVGEPGEVAALVRAAVSIGNGPDFITVDGAEGGTGAAPPELTNSVGLPLEEGLVVVRNLLQGAGLRDKVRLVASGRVSNGFSLVRTVALGADITCAARAFMMSLGCIQALKCNTNKCPTGIATQDPNLMYGLDPTDKRHRVYHFHAKTVQSAADIVGIMGYESFDEVTGNDIMRRVQAHQVRTLSEHFPEVGLGCLLDKTAPARLQAVWDRCETDDAVTRRWIF